MNLEESTASSSSTLGSPLGFYLCNHWFDADKTCERSQRKLDSPPTSPILTPRHAFAEAANTVSPFSLWGETKLFLPIWWIIAGTSSVEEFLEPMQLSGNRKRTLDVKSLAARGFQIFESRTFNFPWMFRRMVLLYVRFLEQILVAEVEFSLADEPGDWFIKRVDLNSPRATSSATLHIHVFRFILRSAFNREIGMHLVLHQNEIKKNVLCRMLLSKLESSETGERFSSILKGLRSPQLDDPDNPLVVENEELCMRSQMSEEELLDLSVDRVLGKIYVIRDDEVFLEEASYQFLEELKGIRVLDLAPELGPTSDLNNSHRTLVAVIASLHSEAAESFSLPNIERQGDHAVERWLHERTRLSALQKERAEIVDSDKQNLKNVSDKLKEVPERMQKMIFPMFSLLTTTNPEDDLYNGLATDNEKSSMSGDTRKTIKSITSSLLFFLPSFRNFFDIIIRGRFRASNEPVDNIFLDLRLSHKEPIARYKRSYSWCAARLLEDYSNMIRMDSYTTFVVVQEEEEKRAVQVYDPIAFDRGLDETRTTSTGLGFSHFDKKLLLHVASPAVLGN